MALIPSDEAERLKALHQTHLLGTPPEEAFDDLTRLAARLCGMPIACISLVDSERLWFKSLVGLEVREAKRSTALCSHTILEADVFVVPDIAADERFADNPLVREEPHIRFYAGVPLITPEGHALGALCVIDRVPRQLTEEQKTDLLGLARQAAVQIEMRAQLVRQEQFIAERIVAEEVLRQSEMRLLEAQRVAQIGSWEFDVDTGRITWSAEMFRLLGFNPTLGEPDYDTLMTHYHPEDVVMHTAVIQQAIEDGLSYEFDIRILSCDGMGRWGHAKGQAARDDAGRVARLFGTVVDITERKQTEEENARLAAIIEYSHDAVLGLTLDGILVSWNASAERLYGYKEEEIIGQHASVLAPPEQRGFVASVIQALRRGEERTDLEVQNRRRDGTSVNTVLTFSPIRNQAGDMVGVAVIGRDVTDQRRAEEAVRRSEARLAEAQRVARLGSWEIDARTGEITFSQEMYALFELDSEAAIPPRDELLRKYHPDDVEEHSEIVSQAMAECRPFETDTRIMRQDGTVRWCHIVGEPILDSQGNLLRLIGTSMDITERVMFEERFRVLFEHSSEAHFLINAEGIIDCNQAALQMLRCSNKTEMAQVRPVHLSPQHQPDGRLSAEAGYEMEALAFQQGTHCFEWTHRRMTGEEFPTKVILTPVTLNGKPALLSVWHDLTERKQAEQRIRDYSVILEFQKQELELANRELCDLATTDGLTGLKNHRAFQERLLSECETADRHQTPLSLLLLDVDHFKQFNDAFGHPAGDAVLKQVARQLERTMRDCDFVGRYGGEEFVIILPQTDKDGALRAAERCRLAIENAEWDCRAVTASFGVATLSLDCTGTDALIAAADQALYTAKSNGRNQTMHSQSFCLKRQ